MKRQPFLASLNAMGRLTQKMVSDYSKATLQGIISIRVDIVCLINFDKWRGYNGPVDFGYEYLQVDPF